MTGEVKDQGWERFEAVLMTTERVEVYGGIRFGRSVLEDAATDINASGMALHLHHDQRLPIRVRNLRAEVVDRDDGVSELAMTGEMPPDDAPNIALFRGMSTSMTTALQSRPDEPMVDGVLVVAADAAWFSDEALEEAEGVLLPATPTQARRAYQFSLVPDPQIFLDVPWPVLRDLLIGVGGNLLTDALKRLFRSRRTPEGGNADAPTRINFTVTEGDREVRATVETASEHVAELALGELGDAVRAILESSPESLDHQQDTRLELERSDNANIVWDEEGRAWTPPG